jgi:hypothetical protein
VRCALTATAAIRDLGAQIRVGLHTGEIELGRPSAWHSGSCRRSNSDSGRTVGGTHFLNREGSRSGIDANGEDRGEHSLKGLPGMWHLYRVALDSDP